jgi:hypothetical protein
MARSSTGKLKRRVNLDLEFNSLDKIDAVKAALSADSMIEVIRRAIDLIHYVTVVEKDSEIKLHKPGETPVLVKPF